MLSAVHCFTFPRSSFRVNINEAFHKIFSHEIFFFNQSTACLSPSEEYSQGISTPLPAPLFTLFPVIFQLIPLVTTFRQSKKHRHPQAETFWHMTNEKPIFHYCNGVFIFNILWLSATHKTFFNHWRPYFWYTC